MERASRFTLPRCHAWKTPLPVTNKANVYRPRPVCSKMWRCPPKRVTSPSKICDEPQILLSHSFMCCNQQPEDGLNSPAGPHFSGGCRKRWLTLQIWNMEKRRFQYIISILIELFLLRPLATEAPQVLLNIYSNQGEGGRHSDISNHGIKTLRQFKSLLTSFFSYNTLIFNRHSSRFVSYSYCISTGVLLKFFWGSQ